METVTSSLVSCAFACPQIGLCGRIRGSGRSGGGCVPPPHLKKGKRNSQQAVCLCGTDCLYKQSSAESNLVALRGRARLASPVCLLVYLFIYLSISPINLLATAVVEWRRLPGLSSGNVVVSFSSSFCRNTAPSRPTRILRALHVHFFLLVQRSTTAIKCPRSLPYFSNSLCLQRQ